LSGKNLAWVLACELIEGITDCSDTCGKCGNRNSRLILRNGKIYYYPSSFNNEKLICYLIEAEEV